MANWVGYALVAILVVVAILTMWSKSGADDRDWPVG